MEPSMKKRVLRRLAIIRGQIAGLERMVKAEKYCVDIITQSSAIQQALSGVEQLMLENHLETHVVEQMKSGKHKQAIREMLKVYALAKRR